MTKLFRKKEILFAIVWIVVYVVGSSVADSLSEAAGLEKSITLIFDAVLCITAVLWIKENNLAEYFGLCKSAAAQKLDNIIIVSLIMCAVSVAYALWLIKTLPEKE